MDIKHFDITFLEDTHVNGQKEFGQMIINLLSHLIDSKQTIIIERRPVNAPPEIIEELNFKNANSFIKHWKSLFDNLK